MILCELHVMKYTPAGADGEFVAVHFQALVRPLREASGDAATAKAPLPPMFVHLLSHIQPHKQICSETFR
jgi:hypothetical protein